MSSATPKKIASVRVIKAGSAPDVDSDFHTAHRDAVLEHCGEVYGQDKLSNIITFQTLAAKAAFKTMCTIYEVPFAQANKITALIPGPVEQKDISFVDIFNPQSSRYAEANDFRTAVAGEEWRQVLRGAQAIERRIRATGVHPCGVIISSKPLIETIPLQVRQSDGRVVSQWTYHDLEGMGLLKFDFLGLDTVDLISYAVENIMKNGKTPPNMVEIIHGDMNDKKTFELLGRGETDGIFQLASPGVKELLRRMKPTELGDIVATTALYRPGPMGMNSHIKYADRKNGRDKVEYPIHPDFKGSALEQILGETYGLCVPEGTMVLNASTGLFMSVETIPTDGSFTTPSINPSGEVEAQVVDHVVFTGEKEVLRLTANGQRSLEVANTHPILTPWGYVEAGDLQVGDLIATSAYEKKIIPYCDQAEDRAWFLGAMLGEGSITGTASPYLTKSEEELRSAAIDIVLREFPGIRIKRTSRRREGVEYTQHVGFPLANSFPGKSRRDTVETTAQRHPIVQWLSELGYTGKIHTNEKTLTDQVFAMSDRELSAVLAGLWDTDGTVGPNGIHLTTTSQGLYSTVRLAFERLGIEYGVSHKKYENVKLDDAVAYRLFPSARSFTRTIQPFLRLSRKRLASVDREPTNEDSLLFPLLMNSAKSFLEANPDEIFIMSKRAQTIYHRSGLTNSCLNAYLTRKLKRWVGTAYVNTRDAMLELGMLDLPAQAALKRQYRRIERIEPAGVKPCYDIEVANNHNFFVSGFVTHNCVYQEQIMQIANQIGGMTLQQGDDLRSAMGKKKKDVMAKMKPIFLEGGVKNGYSEEAIQQLWATLEVFAEYGFNKAHSVAYAMNAYQSAYLKANYPVEFMAALISQNIGRKEKILGFLQEAKRMRLKVGSVDINLSDVRVAPDFTGSSQFDIVYGLSGINSVSEDMAGIIVGEREKAGPFKSVQDVVSRCSPKGVSNRKIYENLALAGAFDSFGHPRRGVVENLSAMLGEAKTQSTKGANLFDMMGGASTAPASVDLNGVDEYPHLEKLKKEAEVIGLFLTSHPLEHTGSLAGLRTTTIAQVMKSSSSGRYKLVGALTEIVVKRQKNGGKSVQIALDDGTAFLTAFLNREIVKGMDKGVSQDKIRNLYENGAAVIPDEIAAQALTSEFVAMEELKTGQVYSVDMTFRPGQDETPYAARISKITKIHLADDGSLPVRLRLSKPKTAVAKKEQVAFVRELAEKHPGTSPLYVAYKESGASTDLDGPFRDAVDYLDAHGAAEVAAVLPAGVESRHETALTGQVTKQVKAGKKVKKTDDTLTRVWPPPKQDRGPLVPIEIQDSAKLFESLTYKPTKFMVAKSPVLGKMIEFKLGIENFDFGVFNPDLLEDNR